MQSPEENVMNLVRLCLTSTALLLTTAPSLADEVLGTWLRDNGALKVKFEPCGDAVCGNVVWLKPGSGRKPKSGSVCSSTCTPMGPIPGPAKPPPPTTGQSIQAKCRSKARPSVLRAA